MTDEVSRLKRGTDSKVRCALRCKDLITRCGGSFSRGEAKVRCVFNAFDLPIYGFLRLPCHVSFRETGTHFPVSCRIFIYVFSPPKIHKKAIENLFFLLYNFLV